jgi:1,2-phenylacetyl-CoA epoxidase catalytic subunit
MGAKPEPAEQPFDVHDLDPQEFLEQVHSFEFWFEAVEGYLPGLTYGHRPETVDAPMAAAEREKLITVLCNYCVGETAALEGASGLVSIAPNRLAKIFLSTQVADEGRHLEVFLHRLQDLGVDDPEGCVERRASRGLQRFRRRLRELVAGKDWEAAIFAQNVLLEALEFAVFNVHAKNADPVTGEVLRFVIKDERRHIGFGENELGRRLASAPHIRARLGQTRKELDPLILDALEETTKNIGMPRDDQERLGRAYLESVERLGFA